VYTDGSVTKDQPGWGFTVKQSASTIHENSAAYWAVQARLLTPLTFARHRLSPLAAFTFVRTFFTLEGGDSEFANFTLPTLKTFL